MGLLPSGKVRKGGSEGQMDVRESDEPRGMGGSEGGEEIAML